MPPGLPVHVIQRGNNRQTIFCSDEDMATYASYIRKAAWRNLIGEVLDAELITKIRQCANAGLVLGSQNFREQVERLRS